MKFSFGLFLGLSLCSLIALTGCRKGLVIGSCIPVEGKVTLGDRPLIGGTVSFIPLEGEGNRPRPEGTIDTQGRYSLTTAGKKGAPPGKYRAILTTSGEDKRQETLFNPLYSHWDRSPLLITVGESLPAGTYDLKLSPLLAR
jgi:hypothetical protein